MPISRWIPYPLKFRHLNHRFQLHLQRNPTKTMKLPPYRRRRRILPIHNQWILSSTRSDVAFRIDAYLSNSIYSVIPTGMCRVAISSSLSAVNSFHSSFYAHTHRRVPTFSFLFLDSGRHNLSRMIATKVHAIIPCCPASLIRPSSS